jgi:hypothetical protein
MYRPAFTVLAVLGLALGQLLHAGEDPLAHAAFSDGKTRSLSDLGDQTTVVMNFCGHCPRSGAYMRAQAKAIHDLIESQHAPARLVCLTPDLSPAELVAWKKERGLDGALVGQDTRNPHGIGLSNIFLGHIYRGGKRIDTLQFSEADVAEVKNRISVPGAGTFRFPVEGLGDPKATELWWMVERDQPQAMDALVAARKNKALKDDAERIYAVVEGSLTRRQDALLAGDASMATYEALETLLGEARPIVLKPAAERLKELGKDPTIKTELKARTLFQQCWELQAQPNPQKQQAGRQGLEELAKRYPQTVYGRKAGGG